MSDKLETERGWDKWISSKNKDREALKVSPEGVVKLAEVWGFAIGKGKIDRLIRALDQACFPTFFGKPAVTHLYPDWAPWSFYFEIEVDGKWAMNGGVIWHESAEEWSVHT